MAFVMNIVYAFGPSWLEYAAIGIFSLLKNNAQPINLYLLTDVLTPTQRLSLLRVAKRDNVSAQIIEVESIYRSEMPSELNVDAHFTRYTLYRLLIPQLLKLCKKALYLDTDTLVLRNLARLYETDISNHLVAAVPDLGGDNPRAEIGLAPEDHYVNAGVLLLNLEKIRFAGLDKQWISLCQNRRFKYHDQDIINMTCKNSILFLDARYNACRTNTSYTGSESDIHILHFISFKPWNQKNTPYADIWRRYRRLLWFFRLRSRFWPRA
jgi:lipopolysaccharide biosynthesis glycosyltransferase